MRLVRFPVVLLAVLPLLLASCGEEEGAGDPCRGVVCPRGYDCVAGECREREVPEPPKGCQVNADCFQDPAGPFCDRGTNECVACLEDDHCGGRTCVSGACRGSVCTVDDDCAEPTPFCNEAGDACVACRTDDDCEAGEGCDAGACVPTPVECSSDADCELAVPSRPFCLLAEGRGLCVECRHGGDCAEGVDCVGGSCVDLRCSSDEDCAAFPDLPICGDAGRCVACETDEHCPGSQICDAGVCRGVDTCSSDDDCAGSADGPVCDPATNTCVACVVDGDCPLGQRCDQKAACIPVSCNGPSDCPLGARCDDGSCVDPGPCTSADDCTFDPRVPQCNAAGRCVACTADAHCAPGQRCIAEACVVPQECTTDAQCPDARVCAGGLCVDCRTEAECPRGTCSLGACVNEASCASDADCAIGVCAGGSCVECITTLDCAPGLWCTGGACLPPPSCAVDAECGPGRTCADGVCSAFSCAGPEEPNDAPATAAPFRPGAPIAASLCANDVDWFLFTAPPGAGLSVTLLAPPAGARVDLAWYDPATRELRMRGGAEGRLQVRALAPAAQQRYYLRVRAAGAAGSYGLLATVTPAGLGCGDALEPNDLRSAPRRVPADLWLDGLDLCGDDDFFSVDVPAGRGLTAILAPEGGATAGVALEIFNDTGATRLATAAAQPWMGGVLAATVAPDPAARTLLVKASTPGQASIDRPYRLLASTLADPGACGSAPPLIASGDRARLEATTLGASADQAPGACGGGGGDLAWRVELDEARRLVVQARADFAARLSLRDASCAGEIACSATLASGVGVLDVPNLAAGTYALVLAGVPSAAGNFELAAQLFEPLTPPANDACAAATDLVFVDGTAVETGTTRGAVADASLACAPGAPEVFYTLRVPAPDSARVVVALQPNAPASLAILDGPPACATASACVGPATQPKIDTVLAPGDWTIAVAAASGAPVDFRLQVDLPPAVGNDTCAAATPISPGVGLSGDTTWAADDLSFAPSTLNCTGYFTTGHDVFYALALAAGEEVEITVTPESSYDVAVYVVDGCAGGQCLAGADRALEGGPETLTFQAPAAGTFYLVVDGSAGGGGYTLQVQ